MDVLSLFGINLLSNTEPILIKLHLVFSQGIHIGNAICHMQAKFSTKAQKNPHIRTYKNQILQKNLQLCYPLELHCSSIVKKNIYIFYLVHYLLYQFLSLHLSISNSLSPFSLHSLLLFRLKTPQPPPTDYFSSLSRCRSMWWREDWRLGFGIEIGVQVWCGDQRWVVGLLWVLFGFVVGCVGSDRRGFLLVVVGMGFI